MRRLALVAAGLGLGLLPIGAAAAQDGETLFEQKCASCHTIGGGPGVGPDLEGVGGRSTRSWLERFIAAPDELIASGDPRAKALLAKYKIPMPNLGLTDAEVAALVDFLVGGSAAEQPATTPTTTTTAAPPATTPAAAGDAGRGKNLFTGAKQLANGGPPCLSCHSVAGIGSLGGGAVGPDLTGAFEKYGPGASGFVGPTMAPIFTGKPLTARERADLALFLEQASHSERPGSLIGPLLGLGLGGVAVLVAAALLVWPRQSLAVRRKLVKSARRS